MTAHSGDDTYYEICIALDSSDCGLAEQLSDIFVSAIMDFSGEAVEIQGAKIIIRTSKDRQFIDALLAHIGDLSANLSAIWQKPIKTTNTIEIKQNRDWIEEYKKGIKALQCGRFYIYPPWESANSACGDFSRSASAHSLQRTPSASHSFASHNHENSLTILEFADSNAESANQTQNCNNSSLRGRITDSHEAIHESKMDCHDSAFAESRNDESTSNSRVFTNPPKQTIEGIAVEVAGFLPNFECETGLGVREHSKFGKSPQDAPKSELQTPQDEFDTEFATINIILEPSLAFGTGHHASTFMCIEAIQALHAQDSLKNKKLLDFGCGSGILALCASKLGAVVDLCDIDESAIIESKKNFNNNNATISHIWQGGIADRVAKKGAKSGIYDIIVANIIASVLIEQKDNIALSLKRGGIAVLSGILDIYKDEVLARFSDFTPLAIRQSDEWICAILQYRKNIA